jgi:hypothetical protein
MIPILLPIDMSLLVFGAITEEDSQAYISVMFLKKFHVFILIYRTVSRQKDEGYI